MRRAVATLALLASLSASGAAHGQSIDACMRAEPAAAVALCESLIDAGRANAAVHAQLVLSLDKDGRPAEARRALDRALERYAGDRDLLDLRERLSAGMSEREQLAAAAARNDSAMSQGKLRLLCLTRDGTEGIDACRAHLDLTDVDGERLRRRLAELEAELAPPADETPPVAVVDPPDASPVPVPTPAPAPAPVQTPDPGPASVPSRTVEPVAAPPAPDDARRTLVANVQRALNALGLDAGPPDGVAGRRTYEALSRFGERTGAGAAPSLDASTLARLDGARGPYETARAQLTASRAASDAGDIEEALLRLERAESASPLLDVPGGYRRGLEAARDAARDAALDAELDAVRRRAADAVGTPPVEPSVPPLVDGSIAPADAAPTAPTDVGAPDAPDRGAADLMTRIGKLERELADAADAQRREEARLRELVARTLAPDGR